MSDDNFLMLYHFLVSCSYTSLTKASTVHLSSAQHSRHYKFDLRINRCSNSNRLLLRYCSVNKFDATFVRAVFYRTAYTIRLNTTMIMRLYTDDDDDDDDDDDVNLVVARTSHTSV